MPTIFKPNFRISNYNLNDNLFIKIKFRGDCPELKFKIRATNYND